MLARVSTHIACPLLLGLWLACCAWTAEQPSAQEQQRRAIESLTTYLKSMGHEKEARRLAAGFKQKTITFGVIGDNALTDVGTPNTIYHVKALDEIFPPKLKGQPDQLALVEWSTTVVHEMKHQDQDPWAWRGGVWGGLAGRNACEREAWGAGFQALYDHARRLHEKLNKAPGSRERLEAGRELIDVCKSYQVYLNSFEAVRGEIGEVEITDREGVPIKIAEAMKEIAGRLKSAQDACANAAIMLGQRTKLNGTWDVTLRYLEAIPAWTSRGEWVLEQKNLHVTGRAQMTDRKGKKVDGVAQGTLVGHTLRLEVKLDNLIEVFEAQVDASFSEVKGDTLESNWAVTVADTLVAGLTGLDGTKVQKASKEELRKFQPIKATWSAKVRP